MTCPEVCHVPDVADDIWDKIFSYLRLDDRKSVRLCCRRFYEVCNSVQLQRDEQMVIHGQRDLEAAIWWLSSSGRKIWNFKLNRICFGDCHLFDERLLSRHGPKVGSLAFHQLKCEPFAPRVDVVASVIRSCPHLRELILVFDSPTTSDCYRYLTNNFRILEAAKVVCPTVDTFSLRVPDSNESQSDAFWPTNGDFLCMFDVFPNIKKLTLWLAMNDSFDSTANLADPGALSESLTFSCVYQQLLKMRGQLVRLRLHFACTDMFGLSPRALLRLGDIDGLQDLWLCWTHPWDDSIANPFLRLKHLTYFEWLLDEHEQITYSEFLLLLLNTATALQMLKVTTVGPFRINYECFRALVASRLTNLVFRLWEYAASGTNLYVDCDDTDAQVEGFPFNEMAPNRTLRRLDISPRHDGSLSLFALYFSGLRNFMCAFIHPIIMMDIFNLRELRDLVLFNCDKYPYRNCRSLNSGLPKQWRPHYRSVCRQLDHLTHLRIVEERSLDLSIFLLSECAFPALKSLKIEINRLEADPRLAVDVDELRLPIQKLSQLESLDIRCQIGWTFGQCCELLEALPKLRSVVVSILNLAHKFLDPEYEHLFRLRPSLRSICIIMPPVRDTLPTYESENLFSAHLYYLRDLITGRVEKRTKDSQAYSAPVEVYFKSSTTHSLPNATGPSTPVQQQCCRIV